MLVDFSNERNQFFVNYMQIIVEIELKYDKFTKIPLYIW